MAKYKLIKIYPKSPPLGTIVEVGNDGYLTYRMRNDYNQEMTSIHKSVLTEYSEFWEEVAEKPLFTTEDSVNIYVGDRVSTVSLGTMELFTIDGLVGSSTRPAEGFKYFSTKEKAEEYINFRKPYLSNKDVLDEIEKCTNIEQLKKVFTNKVAY